MKFSSFRNNTNPNRTVTVQVGIYFHAETEAQQQRPTSVVTEDGISLYEADRGSFTAPSASVARYVGQGLLMNVEEISDVLVRHSDVFTSLINRFSKITGFTFKVIGDVPNPKMSKKQQQKYMRDKQLRDDVSKKSVCFPYIKNQRIGVAKAVTDDQCRVQSLPNSCLATLIVQTFKGSKDRPLKLSYETLWKTCFDTKMPEGETSMPLSLDAAVAFFKAKRLKLVAVDMSMKVLRCYDPADDGKSVNRHISPSILRVLVHQGHAYLINDKVARFDRVFQKAEAKMIRVKEPSTKYSVRTEFDVATLGM